MASRSPRTLETFLTTSDLTTPDAPLPDLEQLRAFRLGGYAYTRLASDHPAKATLQRDFLSDTALHQQVVNELVPLLRAWRQAGIDVLVFKGFYLAEFVYDAPAQRYYLDVDLLIPEAQIAAASEVAREVGWLEPWSAAASGNRYSHEALHLESPNGVISLDVHRLIIHSYLPWHPTQTRLTDAVWRNARALTWHGITLKTLAPEDAFIVGLALNRGWSTDAWRLRPRDYLDTWYLARRFSLTRDALRCRAKELVCERTLKLFLERCDPFRRHLDLTPPSPTQRRRWTLETILERRPSALERRLLPLWLAPQVVTDMLRVAPSVWTAWRLWQQHPRGLDRVAAAVLRVAKRPSRPAFRVVRGVFWIVYGLQRSGSVSTDHPLFVLASFTALRQRGHLAMLIAGEVKTEGVTHASHSRSLWVTLAGETVAQMHPNDGPYLYRAERVYPEASPERR